MPIRLHVEDPELLRRAVELTARETGFSLRLVEKDYFCSVALEYLAESSTDLTFKGGTCLSKVHGGFYRLSEDLDFTIPTGLDSRRASRSRSAAGLKSVIEAIPDRVPGFRLVEPLHGANESTQYNARAGYQSLLDGHVEVVSIEVSVREPTMLDTVQGAATTALLDPVTGTPLIDAVSVSSLSYREAMAEKVRAALCRPDVAIRDYFDVDHAVLAGRLDPLEAGFLGLVRRKITVPGTGPADVSEGRMQELRRQVTPRLRPVLRDREFSRFDLDRATGILRRIAEELARL